MKSKTKFICFLTIFCLMLSATVLCGFKDQPVRRYGDVNDALYTSQVVLAKKIEDDVELGLSVHHTGNAHIVQAVSRWRVISVIKSKEGATVQAGDEILVGEVLSEQYNAENFRLNTTRYETPIWDCMDSAVLCLSTMAPDFDVYFVSRYSDVLRVEEDGSLTTPGLPGAAHFTSIDGLKDYIANTLPNAHIHSYWLY